MASTISAGMVVMLGWRTDFRFRDSMLEVHDFKEEEEFLLLRYSGFLGFDRTGSIAGMRERTC